MNRKRIAQYCCAALVAAGVGLNIQNAIADYGIGENSLSLVAVGQGSNSGSNSNSNGNLPGNIKRNFTLRKIWYNSKLSGSASISLKGPSVSASADWTAYNCCYMSVDANLCDFNMEDKKCATILTRPSH